MTILELYSRCENVFGDTIIRVYDHPSGYSFRSVPVKVGNVSAFTVDEMNMRVDQFFIGKDVLHVYSRNAGKDGEQS